jgi:hypothetical protein
MRILGVCAPAAGGTGSGARMRVAAVDSANPRSARAPGVGLCARAA